jgi:hypothetical protein
MGTPLLTALADEAAKLFQPLAMVIDNPLLLDPLVAEIGAASGTAGGDQLLTAISSILDLYQQLDQLATQPAPSFAGIAAVLEAADKAFVAIRTLSDPGGPSALIEDFGSDVIDLLFAIYLMRWHPVARQFAALLTLVDPSDTQVLQTDQFTGAPGERVPFALDRVHLERLPNLFRDPVGTLRTAYFNDLETVADANAVADKLFPRVLGVLREFGVPCRYGFKPGDEALFGGAAPLVDHALIIYVADQLAGVAAEAGVMFAFSSADQGDLGLVATPFGSLQFQKTLGRFTLELDVTAEVNAVAYGRHGVTLLASASTLEVDGSFTATLAAPPAAPTAAPPAASPAAPDPPPAFLLGSQNGTRLEVGGAKLSVETTLSEATQTLALSADVSKTAIVIVAGDGDGFLQSILPANGVRAEFDLGLAWSNTQGFKVRGAGGLDVTLPVQISVGGVVSVDSIHVGLHADDSGISGECSATAGLALGPVHVVVDRMGLLVNLTFPAQGANLGVLNAALEFKPPSGLGIAIDAGVVTGGGFLSFDPAQSEYSGAANLSIEGVGVSAFGLVETAPQVSFLLLIATTFPVPIELGLDFSLAGVGGLAGINRSMALDALETAVWKGTAKDILFPSAPIASAAAILSELDALFPAAEGRYVFGPTAKIVWGTPVLITAEVGVVIELPDPIRIALIGNVTAQFPPQKPLVLLKVNFAGGIDFGTSRFFFDASLTGSRIESYPLTGDLSVRSAWVEPKNFALAVGGFNPHFQPPAGFPTLSRVGLDISDGPLHLHLAAYLAITTNTFQIGATVDLKASICDCGIAGHFAFDALFTKNPFSFSIDFDASASISADGQNFASVHVSGTLAGPAPWHAKGSASISLLFFSIGISFDRTWGSAAPATLPAVDPWTAALQPALADASSWHGALPAGVHPPVTFASIPGAQNPGGSVILLDPAEDLVLDQKAVPLNQPIERFAESTLPSPVRFDIAAPSVNGTGVDASNWTLVTNEFAPSQFTEMSDDEKLSAESFVALPSGIVIDVGATAGNSVQAALTYDLIIIDSTRTPQPRVPFQATLAMQIASAATGPSARAPWRSSGLGAFAPAPGAAPKAALSGRVFSIVSTANLAAQAKAVASTRYAAGLALADFTEQHASAPGSVQAVPQWEAV